MHHVIFPPDLHLSIYYPYIYPTKSSPLFNFPIHKGLQKDRCYKALCLLLLYSVKFFPKFPMQQGNKKPVHLAVNIPFGQLLIIIILHHTFSDSCGDNGNNFYIYKMWCNALWDCKLIKLID